MWIAEDAPAEPATPGAPTRTVLAHRDRTSAAKAMANYLYGLATRSARTHRDPSLDGMLRAAGDMFAASGRCRPGVTPELRIGGRVYRLRHDTNPTD